MFENFKVIRKRLSLFNPIKRIHKLNFKTRLRYILSWYRCSEIYFLIDNNNYFAGYMILEKGGGRYKFSNKDDVIISPIYILLNYRGRNLSQLLMGCIPNNKKVFSIIGKENFISVNAHLTSGFKLYSDLKYKRSFKTYHLTKEVTNTKLYAKIRK